jgi:hypothetical protein
MDKVGGKEGVDVEMEGGGKGVEVAAQKEGDGKAVEAAVERENIHVASA